jgi:hypothetical protein
MVKWPPSRLISWGKSYGPSVGILIEKVLTSVKHPEQRYRSALGIIRLEKKYSAQRLEIACSRSIEVGAYSYRFVSDMLKNNMDKLIVITKRDEQLNFESLAEKGVNVRGASYYGKKNLH